MHVDKIYLDLAKDVLENGKRRSNRTGIDTIGVFGRQVRYDLKEGFPLLTTKKIFFKGVLVELLWFLRGDTNIKYLQDNGVKIWNDWVTPEFIKKFGRKEGDLGPVYGHQWRNFGGTEVMVEELIPNQNRLLNRWLPTGEWQKDGIDQINRLVNLIKTDPNSRRLIVTGWNPKECDAVALPPCHTLFQFFVENGELSCQLYQRSADLFLGVPFNIASYALLTHMIAHVTGLKVGEFIHSFGDVHIYTNHIDQFKLQMSREPYPMPTLLLSKEVDNIDKFEQHHVELVDYKSHPIIKAEVAV